MLKKSNSLPICSMLKDNNASSLTANCCVHNNNNNHNHINIAINKCNDETIRIKKKTS